jgi:hypothetical protein
MATMRADLRLGLYMLEGTISGQRSMLATLEDPAVIHDETARAHLAEPIRQARALLAEGEREYAKLRRLLGA